jgi:hypothetical protein
MMQANRYQANFKNDATEQQAEADHFILLGTMQRASN